MLYIIDLSYAYFGIIVENDVVINAAPIGRWMIGNSLHQITVWVRHKNGKITPAQFVDISV
jgi:hypothetical protein